MTIPAATTIAAMMMDIARRLEVLLAGEGGFVIKQFLVALTHLRTWFLNNVEGNQFGKAPHGSSLVDERDRSKLSPADFHLWTAEGRDE